MAKLNTNSNAYIIIYSAVLVVIVAFLLAFVYQALKPMQDANVALDVKKQILYSLNIRNLDGAEAEAKYAEVVKQEAEKDGQKYYLCDINGEDVLVVSMKGMGLWGGISGFISIHGDDVPTVYGAYFNHESETAGLGAEIKDSQAWQEKFIGKKVFVDGSDTHEVALSIVKKVEDPTTQVDVVTGATLTSNGVDDMIKTCLKNAGKNVILMQPFGSEFSFYNGDDLDPATDGVGVFYTAKPQSMSAYKGHKITEDMFVKALVPTIENQYKKLDGGQFTNEGSVNVGGAEALKLVGSGKVNDKQVKDVRYVLISGSTLYQFVFSIPEKDFAALSGDIDTIMKSVKFTEE